MSDPGWRAHNAAWARLSDVPNPTEQGLPPSPYPLPRPVVDAHTHLESVRERTGVEVRQTIEWAAAAGVTRLVDVGVDADSSTRCVEIAREFASVVANVALHPNEVARHPERVESGLAVIEALARQGGAVRGVGETGLDYYRTNDPAGQARQRDAFAAHAAIAAAAGLTLVIHDRDAHADVLDVLAGSPRPARIVMHCFSGDADHARRCLDVGAWLSYPGVVTYKANQFLRDALAVTPDDRVLVETDAPYLTPIPARGRPNSPYLLPHTVAFVAEQKGWALDEACERLTANAFAAFGGAWGDDG